MMRVREREREREREGDPPTQIFNFYQGHKKYIPTNERFKWENRNGGRRGNGAILSSCVGMVGMYMRMQGKDIKENLMTSFPALPSPSLRILTT